MAKKKTEKPKGKIDSKAFFPYTTKPASLRKLLQLIPQKPKPPKFDKTLLASWGFKDGNDYSMVRVLKSVGLLSSTNEPTELYAQYMILNDGAAALAAPIKTLYEKLFHSSHEPFNESPDNLRNLFNINSGGSDRSLDQQIQTFKALCDNTIFDNTEIKTNIVNPANTTSPSISPQQGISNTVGMPPVNINLHIHLPENKSSRDYEAMIEDIGRYIFGRGSKDNTNE